MPITRLNTIILFLLLITSVTSQANVLKKINPHSLSQASETYNGIYGSMREQNYLKHYFSPWSTNDLINPPDEIKEMMLIVTEDFIKNPGWGANRQLHTEAWAQKIADNANLSNFPKLRKKAITVHESQVRLLPTEDPSFTDWYSANNGYPFDNVQQSFIPANIPVLVLHTSKDGAWSLIVTPNFFGWIKSDNVAFVGPVFIKSWKSKRYIVTTQDVTIPSKKLSTLPLKLRIGNIYPLHRRSTTAYEVYVAAINSNHEAIIKKMSIDKHLASPFPMATTEKNIASISHQMLGNPYGWGGMYGYRDCSSTLMDLMGTVGIWLPRNSLDQANSGPFIDLKNMTDQEKEQVIINRGVPYFTIIHLPGHIMLYIGSKHGKAYVFHNIWRLHGTVITPIDFSNEDIKSLLSKVDKMTIFS